MTTPTRAHVDLYAVNEEDPHPLEQPEEVEIELMHVRCANTIVVDYDFERNGYRIRMSNSRRDPRFEAGTNALELGAEHEVAFVPAWLEEDWTEADEAEAAKNRGEPVEEPIQGNYGSAGEGGW